ncbi:MAG: histidine phosphatase family protein [Streptosporangiales bacterium]|nr:histidine phosphatase family protein [Streptosporangiales bacterium]
MGARLFFVRHGQTIWHLGKRYAGSSDVDLDAEGLRQARALADWATGAELDLVAASPLHRAVDTAEPAATAAGVPLRLDDRLREQDFGVAEGLTLEELRDRDPAAAAGFAEDPVRHPFPGAEPPQAAARRAVAGLDDLAREAGTGGRVLVVAHGTLLRLVLCTVLGIELRDYRRRFPVVGNGAITELEWNLPPGLVALRRLNAPPAQAVVSARSQSR